MRARIVLILSLAIASCKPAVHNNIGLRNLGAFPQPLRDSISVAIQECYGLGTISLPQTAIPQRYYNGDKGPRYFADSILKLLCRELPDSIDRTIGFTTADIYTAKKDEAGRPMQPASRYGNWGIFGLGQRPGKSCVMSIARLTTPDPDLLRDRAIKISLHEVGHTLGLPHCPDKHCVMTSAAEKLSTVDAAGRSLCFRCRDKVGAQ